MRQLCNIYVHNISLESTSVGQNIATIYGESPGLTASSLVDLWYMELLNINASILQHYMS